jgi:uncharacterized protein
MYPWSDIVTLVLLKLIVTTLVVTAALTPFVMDGLLAWGLDFGYPFSRVFDRVAMVVVLGLLFRWKSYFSLRLVWEYLRAGTMLQRITALGIGLLGSLIMVSLLLPLLVAMGYLVPIELSQGILLQKGSKALLTGISVSIIEEGFFRVLLLTALLSRFSAVPSFLICSMVYAFAHFITPVKSFAYVPGSWLSGFDYLLVVVERALAPGFISAFIGLLIVGLVLCKVIRATKSIYLCIGLHAGWVVGIKITRVVTAFADPSSVGVGAGDRYFLVCQPVTWCAVVATGFFALWCFRVFGSREALGVSASIANKELS